MPTNKIWGIWLLIFLFIVQLNVFAAEAVNGENCENGVCTLSDHQEGDNSLPADRDQGK